MTDAGDKWGLIVFGIIAVIIIFAAIAAYTMTGNMGIEDRYSQAVGLPVSGDEAEGDNFFGFSLEGNHLSYLVVLGLLIIGCYLLYRRFIMKQE